MFKVSQKFPRIIYDTSLKFVLFILYPTPLQFLKSQFGKKKCYKNVR